MPTTDTWAKRLLPPGNPRRLLRLLPITGEPIIQAAVKPQSSVLKLLQEGSFQQTLPVKPSTFNPSRFFTYQSDVFLPIKVMFSRSCLQSTNHVASCHQAAPFEYSFSQSISVVINTILILQEREPYCSEKTELLSSHVQEKAELRWLLSLYK